MDGFPLFSIIIPLFNKEAYIGETLDSIACQTINNYEVLVVDDGSTDNSAEIVRARSGRDSRIRLIQQPNQGVSAARNTAIQSARGTHYAFLDADDAWSADHLQEIQELSLRFPQAGILATAFQRCFPTGPAVSIVLKSHENDRGLVKNYFRYITEVQFIYTSSIVIPAWAVEKESLFPVGIHHGEDLDVWTRMALKWEVAYSGKVSVLYRNSIPGQITGMLGQNNEFDPYYPIQLVKHMSCDNLAEHTKTQLRTYFESYLVRRGGYFFMGRKFSRRAFLNYMTRAGVQEWSKSILLQLMCACPVAAIWRPFFLLRQIFGSRKYLALCGGAFTKNGIIRKMHQGNRHTYNYE